MAGMTKLDMQNTVLLSVHFRAPSCRRKVRSDEIEVDADKALVHVSKDIVDSEEYRAVVQARGRFKAWLLARAIPCSVFRHAIYPLPLRMVPVVDAETERFVRQDAQRVEEFLRSYPAKIQEAKTRLGVLFRAGDYPSEAVMRAAFGVEVVYVSLAAPDHLRAISRTTWEREREKMERMWAEAAQAVRDALRAGFVDLVERMTRRLTDPEDGGRRVIRDAGLERLNDFLESFAIRNLTDDAELAALVRKAKAVMAGVGAAALREDADLRERVRATFAQVAEAARGWEVLKPKRKVVLEAAEEQ